MRTYERHRIRAHDRRRVRKGNSAEGFRGAFREPTLHTATLLFRGIYPRRDSSEIGSTQDTCKEPLFSRTRQTAKSDIRREVIGRWEYLNTSSNRPDEGPLSPHDGFLELCALSTSGELTEVDRQKLEGHLQVCPVCREALQQY